jgi:hypothetical protein
MMDIKTMSLNSIQTSLVRIALLMEMQEIRHRLLNAYDDSGKLGEREKEIYARLESWAYNRMDEIEYLLWETTTGEIGAGRSATTEGEETDDGQATEESTEEAPERHGGDDG